MKKLWSWLLALCARRVRPRPLAASSPIRLWRLLPQGRVAVHRYVATIEDLRAYSDRAHLGMRIYVRTIDRVYQWTPGRPDELDGQACIAPKGPSPG